MPEGSFFETATSRKKLRFLKALAQASNALPGQAIQKQGGDEISTWR